MTVQTTVGGNVAGRTRRQLPPAKRKISNRLVLASQIVVLVGFVVIWALFAQSDVAKRADMSGPGATVLALVDLAATSDYWLALLTTLESWAMALLLALAVGIPIGLFIGRNSFAFDSSKGTIDFLRTIPAVAFVPLFLLILGQSQLMVVLVAMIPAVWPLMIQSIAAGQQADPILHRVARSYGLTITDRITFVLAPQALAFIWPGIRLATTTSLLAVVFSELLGGREGIGVALMDAQIYNQSEQLYAWVLTACFLGLLINAGLAVIQKYVLGWHPAFRGKE
ncbi:ABC transporter permease [Glutamicibacter arilaitensis]|uniref:ABC transporter permease n=1 Tax=Glutamicibacter arilaitensis TaxID=256701 RepID=UPI00384AE82A